MLHAAFLPALRKINARRGRQSIVVRKKDVPPMPYDRLMPHARLMKITLNLARTKAFPEGSIRHGYAFVAPLDDGGHIDAKAWGEARNACTVHRFWGDEPIRRGFLVHRPGGESGATWGFDYDRTTHADDEGGFRFGAHIFKTGEYVSVHDSDGDLETFRIAEVGPA
jgi:hypothetical protein